MKSGHATGNPNERDSRAVTGRNAAPSRNGMPDAAPVSSSVPDSRTPWAWMGRLGRNALTTPKAPAKSRPKRVVGWVILRSLPKRGACGNR